MPTAHRDLRMMWWRSSAAKHKDLQNSEKTVFAIFIFTAKKTKETVRWYSWTDTVMRLLSWYRQSVLTETSALSPWAAG